MTLLALPFPQINPVAFEIGSFQIYWYGLAYIVGFLGGWRYALLIAARIPNGFPLKAFDNLVSWLILAVLIGGRLGYVLFYNPSYYLENPQDILKVWQGGMAFHGAVFAIILALFLFSRRYKLSFLLLGDVIACAAPIGIFLGRIANFINGELFGTPSSLPWAMVFPGGGPIPRHPNQLYEAFFEGFLLFVILAYLARDERILRQSGILSAVFLLGYAFFRFSLEFLRAQSEQTCCVLGFLTTGQLLSLPMALLGFGILSYRWRQR